MRKTESVISIKNPELVELQPVFEQWIKMNEIYCNTFEDDCLYWHKERSSVGSLASAIWICNGFAVEEYPESKIYGQSTYTGRTDLWFSLGKDKSSYVVEAKYDAISLNSNSGKILENRIKENIEEACKGVMNIEGVKDYKVRVKGKLGIVFIVPYISPSSSGEKEVLIQNFLKSIERIDTDLIVFFYNPNQIEGQEYHHPGVAIVGKLRA